MTSGRILSWILEWILERILTWILTWILDVDPGWLLKDPGVDP